MHCIATGRLYPVGLFVCALADDGAAVGCRLFCLQDHVITKAGGAAVIADGKAFPEIGQPAARHTQRYLTAAGAAVRAVQCSAVPRQ